MTNQPKPNNAVREFIAADIRMRKEGEEDSRVFELSWSSEEPYTRWFGPEILDHSDGCVDLSRLNEIGVVLFNHDRNKVIGKILNARIENRRGVAEIEFDSDEASETVYQKVKSGTLKGVSVAYAVDSWEEVMPGKQSADGRFTGPCSIARKWTPYEVSIVSVPADPTVGVGRTMDAASDPDDLRARQLQININLTRLKEE
ncbi:MAG: HK97 family phage prohead protease [Clostridium sp.]|nr:HK97 family phage prohead protease [Clostridium sp.]